MNEEQQKKSSGSGERPALQIATPPSSGASTPEKSGTPSPSTGKVEEKGPSKTPSGKGGPTSETPARAPEAPSPPIKDPRAEKPPVEETAALQRTSVPIESILIVYRDGTVMETRGDYATKWMLIVEFGLKLIAMSEAPVRIASRMWVRVNPKGLHRRWWRFWRSREVQVLRNALQTVREFLSDQRGQQVRNPKKAAEKAGEKKA